MNHPMRRSKQQLSSEEAYSILEKETEGVLSLIDPDDMPYGVPLNYVLDEDTLYFHCAKSGRKLECVACNPAASFCVIEARDVIPAEFSTHYRSAIASGKVKIVEDENHRINALSKLGLKFNDDPEACEAEIAKDGSHCLVLALEIENITGKEARALAKARLTL